MSSNFKFNFDMIKRFSHRHSERLYDLCDQSPWDASNHRQHIWFAVYPRFRFRFQRRYLHRCRSHDRKQDREERFCRRCSCYRREVFSCENIINFVYFVGGFFCIFFCWPVIIQFILLCKNLTKTFVNLTEK